MKKFYDRIVDIRGSLITVNAKEASLGELAQIQRQSGQTTYASVLRIDGEKVTLQAFEDTRGISTGDRVCFLNHGVTVEAGNSLLGRRFNGVGDPIDEGPRASGEKIEIGKPSFNPVRRIVPHQLVRKIGRAHV